MHRLRLIDLKLSRLPAAVGLCANDTFQLAEYVNSAQQRLLYAKEAGDDGWWATWAEVAFTVSQTNPYWTAPRNIARIQSINVCERPIQLNNQFVEYLEFGNGRMPKNYRTCEFQVTQAYTRNNVPTFVDLSTPPQYLTVYFTDPADEGKRVLFQGTDANSKIVYSQDGLNQVEGEFVTLSSPFASTPQTWTSITGIQKDITNGQVQIYQTNPTTGAQVLLVTMEPTEQTASYRRYYFHKLPSSCCFTQTVSATVPQNLTLTALAKLDLVPVYVDTDYLLLQNREAIIHECQAIRYSNMDTAIAERKEAYHHNQAIRLLIGELAHFVGIDDPAVEFAPFGAARLEKLKIGSLV